MTSFGSASSVTSVGKHSGALSPDAAGGRPNNRLRVLYYNHSAEVSGAEISLLLTLAHMQDVDALLAAPRGELLNRAVRQGISVTPVRSYRARMTRNPVLLLKGVFGTFGAGMELRRIVGRTHPDILHANSIRAGLIALVATAGSRTRVIWHVRDNLPENLIGKAVRLLASWRVCGILAISQAIRSDFARNRQLQKKTSVVHNGIDITLLSANSVRPELCVPGDRFVVAVIGQITPWKRQHNAIGAFAKFHRRVPDSELWIVGDPKFRRENIEYHEQLRKLAARHRLSGSIRFLGFRSDIMNVMASVNTLLIPSENEPFGRVVIEAMLAGKPVIGTRGGGIPEIVVDGETGYLVDIGDEEAMAQALERLSEDAPEAIQMGARGKNRVCENFSIQAKAREIYNLYLKNVSDREEREPSYEEKAYRFGSQ